MSRFVILRHEFPPGDSRATHWDLMLEREGVLLTWALENELQPELVTAAQRLADHRLAYLTYEGPISGNRGSVTRWDSGEYEWLSESATEVIAQLTGEKLLGRIELTRAAVANSDVWSVRFTLRP